MMQRVSRTIVILFIAVLSFPLLHSCAFLNAQGRNSFVYIRFKVLEPELKDLTVILTGYRHEGAPWRFPIYRTTAEAGKWSEWINLSGWNWHGKIFRSGGIAEYPSLSLTVKDRNNRRKRLDATAFEVELSDAPSNRNVAISFKEKSNGDTIVFLAPYPLRKNAGEFETGRQMADRHTKWASEATGGVPIEVKKFNIISAVWAGYDRFVYESEVRTLKSMGFNGLAGTDFEMAGKFGMKTVGKTWLYRADPESTTKEWKKFVDRLKKREVRSPGYLANFDNMAYYEISDEVSALSFRKTDKEKLNGWFRDYLKLKGINGDLFGTKIETIEYPSRQMLMDALPKDAPINERRLLYHAAKFGQWWSARQLKHTNTLIRQTFPKMTTGTLLPSHGFLGTAWGPRKIGMSYSMLDKFELARQGAVSQISTEDWMGLNHMYGPRFTWTGGQTFGYLNALTRSAIAGKEIRLQTFLTPSDDKYLRLKVHSGLGQGVKGIYYWAYGPTINGTENYWSDLRSQYDGVVNVNRALAKSEEVLFPAKTVSDPVAILYSVSHDIWNNDRHAPFVEKRLLWHALRHLDIQPNFISEEDIEAGKLKNYKVLYITDWNVAVRASAAIDKWVKAGGVLYLSAGAATRDEYNTPYSSEFAKFVWRRGAAEITHQNSSYNERTILPKIKPITYVRVWIRNRSFVLPVIGVRADLNPFFRSFAQFSDGQPAGKLVQYGLGKIVAVGFMPMLAYGKLANFQPKTLEEKWKPEARKIISYPLELAGVSGVAKTNVPVVEVNYLDGPEGAALVLANYTYKPIASLEVEIRTNKVYTEAVSAEGSNVEISESGNGRTKLKLPLEWTDIIVLRNPDNQGN